MLAGNLSNERNQEVAYNLAANAAPLLVMNKRVNNLKDGAEMAMDCIKKGKAFNKLQQIASQSQSLASQEHS